MARKARAEVEGGLYHVITLTRGNNRQTIVETPRRLPEVHFAAEGSESKANHRRQSCNCVTFAQVVEDRY